MDPVTLATTAVTVLSPYLVKAGEKAFETIGEKSVDSLWQSIKAKFTGKPAAEEAVKDLVTLPADSDNQAAFRKELRKVLEAEPAFAAEFERLLNNAQNEGGDTIVNTGSGEQPTVTLPRYFIARYPVTVAQFGEFTKDRSLSKLSNHPVVGVSWHDALKYCDWLTERLREKAPEPLATLIRQEDWRVTLPSEAEWEKAARGEKGWIYPWGNEFDSNKANTEETGINGTSAVGCFPAGASPYGLMDMSGNVWEWTRSLWRKDWQKPEFTYPYDPQDRRRERLDAPDDIPRVLRGGAYWGDQGDARCAARGGGDPASAGDGVGFRVVVHPKL